MAELPADNRFCWNELATKDAAGAAKFYCEVFGWTGVPVPMGPHIYTRFKQGDRDVGGMIPMTAEWGDIRPHWMAYIHVADVDATAAKIKELGGSVCVPPSDIAVGRFAVVQDPAGAVFSIIKMKPM
jgi:predicted enzyme related to lactoylglutathione lyase